MLENLYRKHLSAGEIIFTVGDAGDSAYLIETGEVEVLDPVTGCPIGVVGQGELLGDIALIDCQPRTATVRATRQTRLIEIKHSLVVELLDEASPIIRRLMKVILERNRDAMWHRPVTGDYADSNTDALQTEVVQRLTLIKGMNDALHREEFELHYQPIFTLPRREIAGFEALIRWRHPEHGLIPPSEFLEVAEEVGLIRQLGR
jgi:CRP-like cAMP-binding protein